jgi:hypothetical protein
MKKIRSRNTTSIIESGSSISGSSLRILMAVLDGIGRPFHARAPPA